MAIGLLLLEEITKFFIIIIAGIIIVKTGILSSKDSKSLSTVLLYLVMPCVIINAFQIDFTMDKVYGMLLTFAASVIIHIILWLVAKGVGRILGLGSIEQLSVMYANVGNMLLPIVMAVLGSEWLLYTSIYGCVQTILLWTHCKSVISGQGSFEWKKVFLNINMLAIGVGLILFFTRISLPVYVTDMFSMVGNMMGPLSMLVIGMVVGSHDLKELFTTGRLYLIALLRLVLCPLIILLVLFVTGVTGIMANGNEILFISFLAVCTPVASTITQFSQLYDKDSRLAGSINIVTTLLCIVTMPLMAMLYGMIFNM